MNKDRKFGIAGIAGRLTAMIVLVLALLLGIAQTVHAAGKLIPISPAGVSARFFNLFSPIMLFFIKSTYLPDKMRS